MGNSSDRISSASKISPARRAALEAIRTCRTREAFAQDIMEPIFDHADLSSRDRSFATKLVLGVVSTAGVLDEIIDRCMDSPDDVTAEVRDALRISVYEIIFLDKSVHAAVDQGVELVRSIAGRAGGLANAVLRRVVAAKADFPFGDPDRDIAACARFFGFPVWLAEKLVQGLGDEAARVFMEVSNDPAVVYVAVNAIKADDPEMYALLSEAGASPEPVTIQGIALDGCFRIQNGRVLRDERVQHALSDGKLLVSDAASQCVARLVLTGSGSTGEKPPASFLEIGAGRATKTILLQSNAFRMFGEQIKDYVAVDNHDFKIKLLRERARVYGVHVSEARVGDATALDEIISPEHTFGVVFVDAPCTGLGTLRRHPEIRWRLEPTTIEQCARLDTEILQSAASFVAPGGILAYATCTTTFEEDSGAVTHFLESEQGRAFEIFSVGDEWVFSTELMHGGCDAHFLMKMQRVSADRN